MIFSVYSLSGKDIIAPNGSKSRSGADWFIEESKGILQLMDLNNCAVVKISRKAELGSDFHVIELQDE